MSPSWDKLSRSHEILKVDWKGLRFLIFLTGQFSRLSALGQHQQRYAQGNEGAFVLNHYMRDARAKIGDATRRTADESRDIEGLARVERRIGPKP